MGVAWVHREPWEVRQSQIKRHEKGMNRIQEAKRSFGRDIRQARLSQRRAKPLKKIGRDHSEGGPGQVWQDPTFPRAPYSWARWETEPGRNGETHFRLVQHLLAQRGRNAAKHPVGTKR